VHRRGRLIQYEDWSVFQEGAGDGDALTLPARQGHPPLSNIGVVALGEVENKLVGVGGLGRLQHMVISGARASVSDVVADGAGEQDGVRKDKGDLIAK